MWLSPGAALFAAAQNNAHARTGGEPPMAELLQSFSDTFDSSDCYLLLLIMLFALGMVFAILSMLMIWLIPHPPHQSLNVWHWVGGVSGCCAIASLVALVEPRPMHWLPSLQSMKDVIAKGEPKYCVFDIFMAILIKVLLKNRSYSFFPQLFTVMGCI